VVGRDKRGEKAFVRSAAKPLVLGAIGLATDLSINAASSAPWPEPLRWIAEHPWPALGALVGMSVALGAVGQWRSRDFEGHSVRPGAAPPAPDWTVRRPETAQVLEALLQAEPGGAVGITAGVHGAGGFGKTTVARLVCAERLVHARFGDQVHWVTVGLGHRSRSQIAVKVAEVTKRVTGDETEFPDDPMAAGAHLGALLGPPDFHRAAIELIACCGWMMSLTRSVSGSTAVRV
jgi:hypothetical protein